MIWRLIVATGGWLAVSVVTYLIAHAVNHMAIWIASFVLAVVLVSFLFEWATNADA